MTEGDFSLLSDKPKARHYGRLHGRNARNDGRGLRVQADAADPHKRC
jgi:hypothetical protein